MMEEILTEIRDETGGEMQIDEDEVKGIAVLPNKYIVAFKPMERCFTTDKGVIKYADTLTFWRKSRMCETTYKTHVIGKVREFLSKKTVESVQEETRMISPTILEPVPLKRNPWDILRF